MPTERWHQVEQLFADAMAQPAEARADFLAQRCGPDQKMRDEVSSLLAAVEQGGAFLSAPALDAFSRQISREGWRVQPGDRLGCYTIERRLGAGGMGEVWRARDERLGRDVAIKLLLPHVSDVDQRVQAFRREAYAAGSLNHTNVLTVHDIGDHGGAPYLVTECLEGESLRSRLAAGPLPLELALDIALQVCRGLGAAHGRRIVHRDLKPENIFVARDGPVKILDFGLAKLHGWAPQPSASAEIRGDTTGSLPAGTAGYMAPEQVRGEMVDERADLFALGAVLHEMLAGCRPFQGSGTLAILEAVLTKAPPDLSESDPRIPPELSQIVQRCLAKSPADRFATVAEVVSALDSVIRARSLPSPPTLRALLSRPAVRAALLLVTAAVGAGAWRWVVASRVHWARVVAAPEIQRLMHRDQFAEAFLLARQALEVAPDDPQLRQLWLDVSFPVDFTTDPPGAEVAFAVYRASQPRWIPLGQTPLKGVRMPSGLVKLRISKANFQPIEGSGAPGVLQRYRLDPVAEVPPGMVRVSGGRDALRFGAVGDLADYWIDRFEVTNRQFKEFVDRGGYRRRDYWREPFVEGGRSLSWSEALARFRDTTGQPGPATWASGTYPEGQADFPVGGVSWYEAAAYAVFAGKSLPTMYHWYRAAVLARFGDILTLSNFDGKGPAPVGSYRGLGPFGTYDMAGNVKEWCSTEAAGRRALQGGAWNEPMYMFASYDGREPFERAPSYGFRCVRYIQPPPPAALAPITAEEASGDLGNQKPVDDAVFAAFRRSYAYDAGPLNTVLTSAEETETWRKQTVEIDAAYGGERMRAHLFLPKNGSPPYQTVIFFPGGDAFNLRSSRDMALTWVPFFIRSGRAFLYPVYKATYERSTAEQIGPNGTRESRIAWSRDLGRAIDYLETRTDIDKARLALYGVSNGAHFGVLASVLEPRLKTSVLLGAGLRKVPAPEIDPVNFAPRVRIPILMVNGRYDFQIPLQTAQAPLFALLGTQPQDKKHILFQTGHTIPLEDVAAAIVPWLDRYLGPVLLGTRGAE